MGEYEIAQQAQQLARRGRRACRAKEPSSTHDSLVCQPAGVCDVGWPLIGRLALKFPTDRWFGRLEINNQILRAAKITVHLKLQFIIQLLFFPMCMNVCMHGVCGGHRLRGLPQSLQ